MLTCRQLIKFLDQYVEGELSPLKHAAFSAHLLLCRDCRAYLDSYRKTIALSKLATMPDEPLPSDVPSALINAVRDAMTKE
jgi:anti-sigma factor RsiW